MTTSEEKLNDAIKLIHEGAKKIGLGYEIMMPLIKKNPTVGDAINYGKLGSVLMILASLFIKKPEAEKKEQESKIVNINGKKFNQ